MIAEKTKDDLIKILMKYISSLVEDKNKIEEISEQLNNKYNIKKGRLMYYFNDPTRLEEAELPELALIAEQVALKLDIRELYLQEWFNNNEIKEIRQYYHVEEDDKIELPLTFENVTDLGDGVYMTALDYSVIARMRKHGLFYYNPEIQREGRLKRVGNDIIPVPKILPHKVKEIERRVLKGLQQKTTLAYNCAVETTEHESEMELIYDEKKRTLTITEGTRIDILDGAHRTDGIYQAYLKDNNIQGKMPVQFSNFTTKQAKEYQAELAKATPFNASRVKELAQKRYSDELVSRLKSEGMLKGRISSTNFINRRLNQLTSFEVLSDAFEENWKPEKRSEIRKIASEFNKYLDVLFEEFEDEINNKDSLLFHKMFFIGHVILAKTMYENNIEYSELANLLDNIDFNINNTQWEKLGISKNGSVEHNKKVKKAIEKFFTNINIKSKRGG